MPLNSEDVGFCEHKNATFTLEKERAYVFAHCPDCREGWCISKFRLFTLGIIEGHPANGPKIIARPPKPNVNPKE